MPPPSSPVKNDCGTPSKNENCLFLFVFFVLYVNGSHVQLWKIKHFDVSQKIDWNVKTLPRKAQLKIEILKTGW